MTERDWSEKDWWTVRRATIAGGTVGLLIVLLLFGFPYSAFTFGERIFDAAISITLGAFIGRAIFKHYLRRRSPSEVSRQTQNPASSSVTKAPRTPIRQITTALALLLLVAVWLGVGTYGYVNAAEGLALVLGQATVPLLIAGAIAWSQRKRKRPFAWDIGLAITAALLIWVNREHLLATYDLSRFQSEIRSSSSPEQTLETSDTQMARMMRGVISIRQETTAKIDSIFSETDDPILKTALTPATLGNVDAIRQAQDVVNEKLSLAKTAMPRTESVLQSEWAQLEAFGKQFSEDLAKGLLVAPKIATIDIALSINAERI